MIWQPPSFQAYTSFLRSSFVQLEPAADALLEKERDDADDGKYAVEQKDVVTVGGEAGAERNRKQDRQEARENGDK